MFRLQYYLPSVTWRADNLPSTWLENIEIYKPKTIVLVMFKQLIHAMNSGFLALCSQVDIWKRGQQFRPDSRTTCRVQWVHQVVSANYTAYTSRSIANVTSKSLFLNVPGTHVLAHSGPLLSDLKSQFPCNLNKKSFVHNKLRLMVNVFVS